MPIYEYRCNGCDEVFEVFQKISDPPPAEHTCGATEIERVLSSTSFVLKGGGWYKDLYSSTGKDSTKGGSSESSSTGKSSSNGSSSDSSASSSKSSDSSTSKVPATKPAA